MAYSKSYLPVYHDPARTRLLYAIVIMWGLCAASIVVALVGEFGYADASSKYYLLPWCIASGAVIAAPSLYLFYKGRFDLTHPLVFIAWGYFFPGFVIGGLVLSAGISQPYFLAFIQDEHYNLPLTFVYIMVGYAGITAGFSIPFLSRFGSWLGSWFPKWNIADRQLPIPALLLLCLGMAYTALAFTMGVLGFQKPETIGAYDGIVFLLSLFLLEALFLLWLYIFRAKRLNVAQALIALLLLAIVLAKSAFQGNRGSLIQMTTLAAFAFVYSGRKLTTVHYVGGSLLITLALVIGMIYGTTFRSVKQSQDRIGLDEYAGMVTETFDTLADQDVDTIFSTGFGALARRIDAVSSLAVVVSNYEALAPYEEAWGISNNIYVDTVTFFIPRVIWTDKPVSIDASKYGDLYFSYSENSFTMTPMGDLLRNFGPIGVPIGMVLLGMLLRVLYAAFIENREFSYWRKTVFFMLLTSINFEGVFSSIVPIFFKVGLTALLGIVIVRICARALGPSSRLAASHS